MTLASGDTITVASRERPKALFDVQGRMSHLINGVCSAVSSAPTPCEECKDTSRPQQYWDYTLVTPLALPADSGTSV